eukprot:104594_1
MGTCCVSDQNTADSNRLSNELHKEKQKDQKVKKLLFLGAGGSGKSTIFKQLKHIHGEGWTKEYRMSFFKHIEFQIILEMKLAIECVEFLAEQALTNQHGDDYKLPGDFNAFESLSSEGQDSAKLLKSLTIDPKLDDDTAEAVRILWGESVIKDIYANRANMRIEDSSAHFWDRIDDIIAAGYVPSEEDVLLVRYRTTGVIEQIFTVEESTFHIFDVGGQKSERKKWIHCFENVTAVMFVASLSCYDEVMFEDEDVNSMVDTLDLFGTICNNEWFEQMCMILFLNKKDLFQQKLDENKAITLCEEFKEFEGDIASYDESSAYIRNAFHARNATKDRRIFTHLTCATDRSNVSKVFVDVQCVIVEGALKDANIFT